jgi:hypothetical protein
MSEVTSVNGKTGAVVLKATDVEAIPESEAGEPSGVATLNSGGELLEAQLPSSVETSRPKLLGEVEGVVKLLGSEADVFAASLKGAAEFEVTPTKEPWIAELLLVPGKYTWKVKGGSWIGSEPEFGEGRVLITILCWKSEVLLLAGVEGRKGESGTSGNTVRNGTATPEETLGVNGDFYIKTESGVPKEIYGPKAGGKWPAGTSLKGEKGTTGAEGPEGLFFTQTKLLLPKEIVTYKEPGAGATEKRAAVAESFLRTMASSNVTLTSGTPLLVAIPAPAKTVIHGVGFSIFSVEGTATERTHLWVALLNSKFEVVARGLDYTSSAHTPMTAATNHALLFEATYETGSEAELLYGVICEVMASTSPVALVAYGGNEVLGSAVPYLRAKGNTGQTTPGGLPSPVTPAGSASAPYMCLV